jgi:rRNA maturation endonuclease Nob1
MSQTNKNQQEKDAARTSSTASPKGEPARNDKDSKPKFKELTEEEKKEVSKANQQIFNVIKETEVKTRDKWKLEDTDFAAIKQTVYKTRDGIASYLAKKYDRDFDECRDKATFFIGMFLGTNKRRREDLKIPRV